VIFPWWLILGLVVVLLVTVLPPRGASIGRPWGDEPAAEGGDRMARADDWLARLKAACDAGYYKADGPQAPPPPCTASCRDCIFWRDDFCRLLSARRLREDAICPYFYEEAAVGTGERRGDEASG
jgi:hypothetical protein